MDGAQGEARASTLRSSRHTLVAAWAVLLLGSVLPRIVLEEVFSQAVSRDAQAIISLSVIGIALLVTVVWEPLRALRPFLVVFLVLVGGHWFVHGPLNALLPIYRTWLRDPSFNVYMLAEQSLNILLTLVMIATLLLLGKHRQDFYLRLGDTAAPAEPVRWLGIGDGTRWNELGGWLTLFISLGTLAFLVITGHPSLDMVARLLPFLPAIVLAAALNSFTEEMTYKAPFLSVLVGPVGPRQASYMVAAYFGILHFYGVPYGYVGVLLAGFLGWLLAKSMLETRGLFWAWFIHFWQDVWIFSFMAVGLVVPGGG
jgi:hypothetical protein